jgi:hypothetical protein
MTLRGGTSYNEQVTVAAKQQVAQNSARRHYPDPAESSPQPHILLPENKCCQKIIANTGTLNGRHICKKNVQIKEHSVKGIMKIRGQSYKGKILHSDMQSSPVLQGNDIKILHSDVQSSPVLQGNDIKMDGHVTRVGDEISICPTCHNSKRGFLTKFVQLHKNNLPDYYVHPAEK